MDKQFLTFKISAAAQVKEQFKRERVYLQEKQLITLDQFTEYVQASYPEFNSAEGFNHIRNVYYGRTADLRFNKMIREYKSTLNIIP